MTNQDFVKHIEKLNIVKKERSDSFQSFVKTLITIASVLLALIITLKSDKSETALQTTFFITTIISTSIGILSGVGVLFADVSCLNKALDQMKVQILKRLDGEKGLQFDVADAPKIYKYIEYVCFSSLLVCLISLTVYAVLINL